MMQLRTYLTGKRSSYALPRVHSGLPGECATTDAYTGDLKPRPACIAHGDVTSCDFISFDICDELKPGLLPRYCRIRRSTRRSTADMQARSKPMLAPRTAHKCQRRRRQPIRAVACTRPAGMDASKNGITSHHIASNDMTSHTPHHTTPHHTK